MFVFSEIAYGYDCKSVSVYPITPADFSDPALKEILSLCFTYGTRVTPTSLRKNETRYVVLVLLNAYSPTKM